MQARPEADGWHFVKVRREEVRERHFQRLLESWGLPLPAGQATLPAEAFYDWLEGHQTPLQQAGFGVETLHGALVLGGAVLQLEAFEQPDWFDLRGVVRFGEVAVPLSELRKHLLAGHRTFALPGGQLALLPADWGQRYRQLLFWAEPRKQGLRLRKPYVGLLTGLEPPTQQPQRPLPLPAGLRATLRPYQQAGYQWLHRLRQQQQGGCLADDMGLGKTLQTLALLLWVYENDPQAGPSLLVMPTSLLDNWEAEARRFTPALRVGLHAGPQRRREAPDFSGYDLVLTTYGTLRQDVDILENHPFVYVILDESQVIKNPGACLLYTSPSPRD